MLKITTTTNQVVYLSIETIKEIILTPDTGKGTIVTERNSYVVSKETAVKIAESHNNRNVDHLITAINNLTQMIRARVH